MSVFRRLWRPVLAVSLLSASPGPLAGQDMDVAGEIAWRVAHLRETGRVTVGGAVVASEPLTVAVYEERGYLPLWTDRVTFARLLTEIEAVWGDGLDPESYHLSTLSAVTRGARDAGLLAERDLLATDALVRLGHDLRFGRTEPQGPAAVDGEDWPFGGAGGAARLAEVVADGRLHDVLLELRPTHFVYRGLVRALAELRRIEALGGWEAVPPGPTLARDSVDARIPLLRRRLRLTGDLRNGDDGWSLRFDPELEAALRSFQHRHGLNEDGVVGLATLAALNVPVERRIEQVRVNLERARWVAHELPDSFVAVNVAGALVYLSYSDSVAFETRAIVGTGFTQTPVFTAPLLYVELNPTWTVPPGIVGEVLAAVRRDPTYLQHQRMRVLDGSREVDPSEIDFSRYTAADFPYVFRQDPGPANALGRIKLMLPNPHHVYLHDTPTRGLFAKEERLFSHGCVRVEDPVGLAEQVLAEPTRWSRAALEREIDRGETLTIRLASPVQVLVLYWTAAADQQGLLHFYRDVYSRDAAVLLALDGASSAEPR